MTGWSEYSTAQEKPRPELVSELISSADYLMVQAVSSPVPCPSQKMDRDILMHICSW
jgi:hypothetical protein